MGWLRKLLVILFFLSHTHFFFGISRGLLGMSQVAEVVGFFFVFQSNDPLRQLGPLKNPLAIVAEFSVTRVVRWEW